MVNHDAAVAEQLREDVVLFARLGRPEHVVEQQLVTVARGQAAQLQAGAVHDRLPEPADLRMDSELPFHRDLLADDDELPPFDRRESPSERREADVGSRSGRKSSMLWLMTAREGS